MQNVEQHINYNYQAINSNFQAIAHLEIQLDQLIMVISESELLS